VRGREGGEGSGWTEGDGRGGDGRKGEWRTGPPYANHWICP